MVRLASWNRAPAPNQEGATLRWPSGTCHGSARKLRSFTQGSPRGPRKRSVDARILLLINVMDLTARGNFDLGARCSAEAQACGAAAPVRRPSNAQISNKTKTNTKVTAAVEPETPLRSRSPPTTRSPINGRRAASNASLGGGHSPFRPAMIVAAFRLCHSPPGPGT